jgi:hypothetical protein
VLSNRMLIENIPACPSNVLTGSHEKNIVEE